MLSLLRSTYSRSISNSCAIVVEMAVLGQYVIAAAITAQQSTSDVTSDLRRPTDHVISLRAVIGCNKIASFILHQSVTGRL